MARIRTIKPEFQNSQSMGRVSREARLTFIQLWPQCDDVGRLRANSRMLASILFPYDLDAGDLIEKWLGELEREGCITRYTVNMDEYLQVCHWDHQKVDHPKPSRLPPPPVKKTKKTKVISRDDSRQLVLEDTNARALSSTKEGTKEGNGSRSADALPDWLPLEAWNAYVEMRNSDRKTKLTPGAVRFAIKELGKLRDQGEDVAAVIEKSVLSHWLAFYAVKKSNGNGASHQQPEKPWKPLSILEPENDDTSRRTRNS